MTVNRSSEELAMRETIEAWGRARWPDARIMHELAVGGCRIDLVFVCPDDLIGVEIKSSKDTLERLDPQIADFRRCIPELWLAVAPKWAERPTHSVYVPNEMIVSDGHIEIVHSYRKHAHRNWCVLSAMPELTYVAENHRILDRHGIKHPRGAPQRLMWELIARNLTGDQIMHDVCAELRARSTKWKADEPVGIGPLALPVDAQLELLTSRRPLLPCDESQSSRSSQARVD